MNERERLRRQRDEARSGSAIGRVGRVRRPPVAAGPLGDSPPQSRRPQPAEPQRRAIPVGVVLGPILLVAAAFAVGVFVFMALARDGGTTTAGEGDGVAAATEEEAPERTPLHGLTGGATSTASPSRSASPSPSPTPSPTPTTPATQPPTPTPTPPPPPTPPPAVFAATVQVCDRIGPNGECQGEVREVRRNSGWVVLLAKVEAASPGDVLSFDVSGPVTFQAGSVTLDQGGSGHAFVDLYTRDLAGGSYTVTLTRNGEAVASTGFVKRGG